MAESQPRYTINGMLGVRFLFSKGCICVACWILRILLSRDIAAKDLGLEPVESHQDTVPCC